MLRVVCKNFEADVPLKIGDIVDVSSWRNARALESQGYLGPTDAKAPTVTEKTRRKAKTNDEASASSANKQSAQRLRRSPLTSRPRVFETRLAKQGD